MTSNTSYPTKIEEAVLNHGLGYYGRVAVPALGIEHDPEHIKEFLWDYVLKLTEESNKLNIKWSHMDIVMQVHHDRPFNYFDSSPTTVKDVMEVKE